MRESTSFNALPVSGRYLELLVKLTGYPCLINLWERLLIFAPTYQTTDLRMAICRVVRLHRVTVGWQVAGLVENRTLDEIATGFGSRSLLFAPLLVELKPGSMIETHMELPGELPVARINAYDVGDTAFSLSVAGSSMSS